MPMPRRRKKKAPPPPSVTTSPPAPTTPQSAGPSVGGGLLSTIAQGFAFGTGSSLAHKAVDSVFRTEKEAKAKAESESEVKSDFNEKEQLQNCKLLFTQYQKCLETQGVNDPYVCQELDHDFKKCMEYL
jgi:uncharacterized protein HemX